MECKKKKLQNVKECRSLIHEMLRNTDEETTEYYEMIYKHV